MLDMATYLMAKKDSDVDVEPLNASKNGTYTAPTGKAYSPVNVSVPNTYTAQDEGKVVDNGALVAQTARTVVENGTYDTTFNNSFTVDVQKPTAIITATPPFSFRSNGEPLVDWEIEGSSGGVGERTKNMLDLSSFGNVNKDNVVMTLNRNNATISVYTTDTPTAQTQALCNFMVSDTGNYLLSGIPESAPNLYLQLYIWDRDAEGRAKAWDKVTDITTCDKSTQPVEVYLEQGVRYQFRVRVQLSYGKHEEPVIVSPMVRLPSESDTFIPYGYEIPVTCGGTTTDIFVGDAPLTEGESITKAEANVDIPTLNGNNTLIVDTVAQPDSVTIQYYNYVAGIPYNTDGLCLYFASDIGRVRITSQTDHEPDVSSLNSAPYSLTGFDDTTIEVRFTMPENFSDKARLIELGNHDGMILALNLNQDNIEVYANGTWAESFSTTFTGGETYTLSVTIGSGDIKIYVDGVYVEADTYTTFTVVGPIITFANGGAIGMDTRWWPATSDISKVRVYDRVLTAAEIAANYQIDNPAKG